MHFLHFLAIRVEILQFHQKVSPERALVPSPNPVIVPVFQQLLLALHANAHELQQHRQCLHVFIQNNLLHIESTIINEDVLIRLRSDDVFLFDNSLYVISQQENLLGQEHVEALVRPLFHREFWEVNDAFFGDLHGLFVLAAHFYEHQLHQSHIAIRHICHHVHIQIHLPPSICGGEEGAGEHVQGLWGAAGREKGIHRSLSMNL